MFGVRTDLVMTDGESVVLNFAYGYLPKGSSLAQIFSKYRIRRNTPNSVFEESLTKWKLQIAQISLPSGFPQRKQLEREMVQPDGNNPPAHLTQGMEELSTAGHVYIS